MKLRIGNRVKVPVRFGEMGKIVQILHNPTRYGVKFSNLDCVLFYNENELIKMKWLEKGFSWFRNKE